jgi:hypothetical protein
VAAPIHPIERTRRLALGQVCGWRRRWLADGVGVAWSADDAADAVGDALASAMAGGWADHPGAPRFVALKALRTLRGSHVHRGRRWSCRSGATPSAGEACRVGEVEVDPGTWVESTVAAPADGLELRALAGVAGDLPAGPVGDVRRLLAAGVTGGEIAEALGVSRVAVGYWAAGSHRPHRRNAERLAALAAGA